MDSIAEYFSEEKDVLFIRGQRKAKEEVARNLLKKATLSLEQIADVVEVPIAFVLEIKTNLSKK